ncbi:MarR family winged helix-turn-helix transcriptional regulator [Pseudooceanicola aestuarii]|uniref:MarR family winged helix-turn-helix transcriptional regulator n=1 Tax=Pseudooceanicola aestuarii TaxID=2697319 RepID=UPI0013D65A7C|nr:MarR family winged helix-turn-helix transcriptional regulator [Pseudooceanicola aestuarii]
MKRFGIHHILHSADILEARLRQRLRGLNLQPRQARVVDALGRLGTASQGKLARQFDVTPASMSTMTARLINGGWISRSPDPDDPRINVLRLTDKGQDLRAEIEAAWEDMDRMIRDLLGPDTADAFLQGAFKLHQALGAHVPGTQPPHTSLHPEETDS